MTLTTIDIENQHNAVLLDSQAYYYAKRFAAEEATPDKRERVYLNTLAVYGVHNQLQLLETETDLESSNSWHPLKRSLFDVADLVVPGLGKLECVPVMPEANSVRVSPPELESRIAYIAVQFDNEQPDVVSLLGYVRPDDIPEGISDIPLNQLQPFDNLFEHLYELEEANITAEAVFHKIDKTLVSLGKWFEATKGKATALTEEAKAGWQTLGELLIAQPQMQYRFATSRNRGIHERIKSYNFGDRSIGMLVSIEQTTDINYYVLIQMCSTDDRDYLPSGLKLTVLGDSDKVLKEITSNDDDSTIQAGLNAEERDKFSVVVSFGEKSVCEDFTI